MSKANFTLRQNGHRMVTKHLRVHITEDLVRWVQCHLRCTEAKALAEIMAAADAFGHRAVETWRQQDEWEKIGALVIYPEDRTSLHFYAGELPAELAEYEDQHLIYSITPWDPLQLLALEGRN